MGDLENPNEEKPLGGYSPLAKGYLLGILVLTASIEAVIPMILGSWLDKRYQTAPLFVLLGIGLGIVIMVTQYAKDRQKGLKPY